MWVCKRLRTTAIRTTDIDNDNDDGSADGDDPLLASGVQHFYIGTDTGREVTSCMSSGGLGAAGIKVADISIPGRMTDGNVATSVAVPGTVVGNGAANITNPEAMVGNGTVFATVPGAIVDNGVANISNPGGDCRQWGCQHHGPSGGGRP